MTILILLSFTLLLVASVFAFLQFPQFGKIPEGERRLRIQKSVNFRDGSFQNQNLTPDLSEGVSYFNVIKEFLFYKNPRNKPSAALPSKKINLLTLDQEIDVLVWFGHSSYFLQVDGKKILVDPVLSGAASPIEATTRSFPGTDVYTTDDLPEIDYLLISHDHWDHLDYMTLISLKPKIKLVITGLGTGAHLEHWGFDPSKIIEKDWNESQVLENGFSVTTTPARHFSGRAFKRNQALWVSFVLQTPTMKIFIGGDSGFDSHFKEIGLAFGSFDLALLECGQYDKSWKYIHMMPEEVVQAAVDLNAKAFMPVHWAKFSLANHAWDEPIIRITKEAKRRSIKVLHPLIGEEYKLKELNSSFDEWWKNIE